MINDIPYHSRMLSICVNKNFRFRSPLRQREFINRSVLVQSFKVFLNSGLIITNPWMDNEIATSRETLSTPVKQQ